ncbi:MAG: hypothetical protein AABZ15_04595 [Nitrospirota bacterium]
MKKTDPAPIKIGERFAYWPSIVICGGGDVQPAPETKKVTNTNVTRMMIDELKDELNKVVVLFRIERQRTSQEALYDAS